MKLLKWKAEKYTGGCLEIHISLILFKVPLSFCWKYTSPPHILWAPSQWARLVKWSNQSLTINFFFFSLLQPPPETLPENEVYFVTDNKKTKQKKKNEKKSQPKNNNSAWLSFLYSKLDFCLVKEGRPCTFPESRELFILYGANHFALVKEANKSYTNGREERGSEGTRSSQMIRTSGYMGTLEMESGQELASTLSSE